MQLKGRLLGDCHRKLVTVTAPSQKPEVGNGRWRCLLFKDQSIFKLMLFAWKSVPFSLELLVPYLLSSVEQDTNIKGELMLGKRK